MSKLFSDDEGSVNGDNVQLTINEHYAKAYEYRKEREEYDRLKEKYGSDFESDASDISTDSESAESEDEDGEELTPAVDAAILRTLARIRKKDPGIYDSEKNIFGEEKDKVSTSKSTLVGTKSKDKSKPMTIRQANLDAMLHGSRSPSPSTSVQPLTHAEEQENLRRDTIAAFHGAAEDGDGDDFLIPREKTQDELEREEEEYREFLQREVGDLNDLVSIDGHTEDEEGDNAEEVDGADKGKSFEKESPKKKGKKKRKEDADVKKSKKSKAEEDQEFLIDYILNRGWVDHSRGHVPTYKEVISKSRTKDKSKKKKKTEASPAGSRAGSGADSDSDSGAESSSSGLSSASFDSLRSHFEASYNHRFEEPNADTITTFPRALPNTIRRLDTTRKDARERKKKRKEEEVEKRKEEMRRLKALKMREVRRKLEKVGKEGGFLRKSKQSRGEDGMGDDFVDEALKELDLEGEWDPEKHDTQMKGLFERYADDEGGGEGDERWDDDDARYDENGKPIWEDDIDIGDIEMMDDDAHAASASKASKKEKKKKKKKKQGGDDEDIGVDVDAMDADAPQLEEDEEEWDGTEEMRKRKLDEYMEEIYKLEFNDMVGDMPTRFKYVPVQPTSYALTPAEILMASDKDLNEFMSVKKYAPYRQDHQKDKTWIYQKKNQEKLGEFRKKVGEKSGWGIEDNRNGLKGVATGANGEVPKKKRKGKKERMKAKGAVGEDEARTAIDLADETSHKRKRELEVDDTQPDENDGEEDGPKKKRKRKHKRKEGEGAA